MLFHFISNHFLPSLFFLTELIDRSLGRDKMKTVSLNEIEYLNLDNAVTEQEKSFLYNCVKAQKGENTILIGTRLIIYVEDPLPGSSKRPWQTPKREQSCSPAGHQENEHQSCRPACHQEVEHQSYSPTGHQEVKQESASVVCKLLQYW